MTTYQKRYLWCERTEAEYIEIRAEIEKRRVEMLALDQPVQFDWPARKRELEEWLDRGRQFIDRYALGFDDSWASICDRAQHGWDKLKTEAQELLDENQS